MKFFAIITVAMLAGLSSASASAECAGEQSLCDTVPCCAGLVCQEVSRSALACYPPGGRVPTESESLRTRNPQGLRRTLGRHAVDMAD
ncbi:hypothetical protein FQN54_004133 [Arachnomyces sp. PD_36]|nr:hypothetical protein FQN54_004133 [Arachnomyces sp. PD_36]